MARRQGLEDLLLAYPTADTSALRELALRSAADPDGAPLVMVDCVEHLEAIEAVLGADAAPVRVCIDIDASWRALGGRIEVGPSARPCTRPSRRWRWRGRSRRPQIELDGLMAYEAQIAGVGDKPPGRPPPRRGDPLHAGRSRSELAERRAAIVAAIGEFCELRVVNGGGTGSLETTAAEAAVTEVTAGSGLYAPALFDHYSRFSRPPAAALRAADRAQARAPES